MCYRPILLSVGVEGSRVLSGHQLDNSCMHQANGSRMSLYVKEKRKEKNCSEMELEAEVRDPMSGP